jgi:hypothetical protein
MHVYIPQLDPCQCRVRKAKLLLVHKAECWWKNRENFDSINILANYASLLSISSYWSMETSRVYPPPPLPSVLLVVHGVISCMHAVPYPLQTNRHLKNIGFKSGDWGSIGQCQ